MRKRFFYIAGAWTEQHQRARPMIAKLKEAGLECTCDWTKTEGDICACGHHREEHAPTANIALELGAIMPWRADSSTRCERMMPTGHVGDVERCPCPAYNGIGVGSDAALTPEQRRQFAQADLDGVLAADIVWLLAANEKGATGSWVELGAALTLKELARAGTITWAPTIVVSGPKWNRTIFTDLAQFTFPTDEEALNFVLEWARTP